MLVALQCFADCCVNQDPLELLVDDEFRASVDNAIRSLPVAQREVVTMFYIGTYSQKE
jgi:DNA-directed RNA polymerase specialized sigma24 family protein